MFEFQFEKNLIDSMPCDIKFINYQQSIHSFALCSVENETMEQIIKKHKWIELALDVDMKPYLRAHFICFYNLNWALCIKFRSEWTFLEYNWVQQNHLQWKRARIRRHNGCRRKHKIEEHSNYFPRNLYWIRSLIIIW